MKLFKHTKFQIYIFLNGCVTRGWQNLPSPCMCYQKDPMWNMVKMFRYNPKANYQPSGGHYLQFLSGRGLYKPTIAVSSEDTFPARFLNIFVDYPLGQMCVSDKL